MRCFGHRKELLLLRMMCTAYHNVTAIIVVKNIALHLYLNNKFHKNTEFEFISYMLFMIVQTDDAKNSPNAELPVESVYITGLLFAYIYLCSVHCKSPTTPSPQLYTGVLFSLCHN